MTGRHTDGIFSEKQYNKRYCHTWDKQICAALKCTIVISCKLVWDSVTTKLREVCPRIGYHYWKINEWCKESDVPGSGSGTGWGFWFLNEK